MGDQFCARHIGNEMPVRSSSENRCPKFLDVSRKLRKEWEVNRHSMEVGEGPGYISGAFQELKQKAWIRLLRLNQ